MAYTLLTTTTGNQEGCDEINGRFDVTVGHTHDGTAMNGGTIVAGSITNVPAGNITATTVQAAINELDTSGVSKLRTSRTINGVSFDGSANIVVNPIAIINETQASGTQGGTFTSGAYRTRTLNTIVSDEIGITLSSNQFTLPTGKYLVEAMAPAYRVDFHTAILKNITDSTVDAEGTSEFSYSAAHNAVNKSSILKIITITSSKVFEIQHQCTTTYADQGLGRPASFSGKQEIYTQIKITKVG